MPQEGQGDKSSGLDSGWAHSKKQILAICFRHILDHCKCSESSLASDHSCYDYQTELKSFYSQSSLVAGKTKWIS
jgi:hypothetical protein